MHLIERISNNISVIIGEHLNIDEDHREVLAYGAFAALQILWSIFLVIVFGGVFDVLLEAVIISFTGAILRKYSGGAHATSPNRCAVMGVIMAVGLGIIINKLGMYLNITTIIIYIFLSYLITYYCVYKYAPVDTPNKPIVKEENKRRLKKRALRATTLAFTITICLLIIFFRTGSYNILMVILSISSGLINQAISLTTIGHLTINRLDIILSTLSIK